MLALDIGYSASKLIANGKIAKIPSAISYASSAGIDYGETETYTFEGDEYVVGKPSETSFVTTDFKFIHKFGPLIAYHSCKKLGIDLSRPVIISTGLAVSDWSKKDEFVERFHSIKEINGEPITFQIKSIMPQGAGVYFDWISRHQEDKDGSVFIIDIGYNTINTLLFENGKPDRQQSAAHVGAGVSTVIKEFTKYLENRFNVGFSEQEALKYFVKNKFTYQGVPQQDVPEQIAKLKKQFVQQLFKSILTGSKKTVATADRVLIAGGGAYILKETPFPPNVAMVDDPYEFSNVRGYSLYL